MNTQFLTDINGNKIAVIVPIMEYKKIIEQLEELEDIELYDNAKKNDTGERILFSDYLKKREKRKNA